MNCKTIAAAAFALALSGAAAGAATMIDLTEGGDVTAISGDTGRFRSGAVSGSILADARCEPICKPRITQNASDGLGISVFPGTRWLPADNPAIDGDLLSETMTFLFDRVVKLYSVTFGQVDHNDDWNVTVNGTQVAADSDQNPFLFGGVHATSFSVTANAGFFGHDVDDFTVKSIHVAAVPVPAAGLLLAGGLVLIGAAGRRRRA